MSDNTFPENLLYNKDYSWVKVEEDTVTLGVIEPAASRVKEFVFIKLPEKGKEIERNETYTSLEAVKWSGHLSSPVSGTVIDVNSPLFDEPSTINQDPYGEGWIAKIRISDQKECEDLMGSEEAKKWFEHNN